VTDAAERALLSRENVAALAAQLNEAHEELEADMQAIANDAQFEGKLVVGLFPENFDLSWILCCSKPSRACERGHRPDPDAKKKPKPRSVQPLRPKRTS